MALTQPEDAASVLEMFMHDAANIPAEITHLMEEIQAKDLQISAFKDEIIKRDAQLQKWVRLNGGHVHNPKEDAFAKTISDCYDKCEILQAEKCGLSEKAMIVLDRQVKRLDVGLRSLAQTEQFPSDWVGPSLLTASTVPATVSTSASTGATPATGGPLQAVSANIGNIGGTASIANAAQMRLAQNATTGIRGPPNGGISPINVSRSQREGSSEATKRRRLNASLGTLPNGSSHLRQSSLGPGTPKAGTPNPTSSSRAGSAQPSRPNMNTKKVPIGAASRRNAPPPNRKSRPRPAGTNKKDRRRQLTRDRATPSTNASLSGSDDEESVSPTPSIRHSQQDGSGDRAEDDEGDDETLYCTCQKVSFGDMVGCDNDDCPYQWFHYKCVGLTEEPKGQWVCQHCRALPKSKVKITKDS